MRRPEPADVQNAGEAPVADEHVSRHQVSVGYLDIEDLLHIVELEDLGPVCDLGLLDSATARARSSAFGEDAYPSLEAKAAALLDSIRSSATTLWWTGLLAAWTTRRGSRPT